MDNMKKELFVNTRMTAEHDPVRTKLTIDATNLTVEDMMEYVVDSAVIKWQSAIRRKKDSKIPSEATYVVPKPGTRAAVTLTPFQMLEGLFGKEKALELVNEADGSVEAVIENLKGVIG